MEVYSYELRHRKSGESDADMEKRAIQVYQKSNNGKPFQLMHCFNIMRKFDKWSPEIMQVPSESGGSNKRSGPDTPIQKAATPTRPDGIKKIKRKEKEAATSSMSSVNLGYFNSSFEERASQRNELGERMLNLIKEQGEERKKQKEEATKFRILNILIAKPVLDEGEAEMYQKLKDEFNNKFNL